MLIYKIFRAIEWTNLRVDGTTIGAPIDINDGYIHFSTAKQVKETATKYFADLDDLFLIAVDKNTLGDDLKWEPSRGGVLFPHLYRKMTIADVYWAKPLLLKNRIHQFPTEVKFE